MYCCELTVFAIFSNMRFYMCSLGKGADEGGGGGVEYTHFYDVAYAIVATWENCGFVLRCAPYELVGATFWDPFNEHFKLFADVATIGFCRQGVL